MFGSYGKEDKWANKRISRALTHGSPLNHRKWEFLETSRFEWIFLWKD